MVLYNGEAQWTAPVEIAELIDPRVGFSPKFRYYKLAENEFSQESLERIGNLVSALFLVETMNPDDLSRNVETIATMLRAEGKEEIELFRLWLANLFGSSRHALPEALEPLMEVRSMLATKLEQLFAKGKEVGKQEGKTEGKIEGKLETAKRLKNMGIEIHIIAEATNLPEQEITAL